MDRWRTYQEAADLLGSTADAVRVRARRHGWKRRNGNDGRVRVLVPADEEPQPVPKQQGGQSVRTFGRSSPEQNGQNEQPGELRLALELLRDQVAEHRRERERAEAREAALHDEIARLTSRVVEAEAAAIEGWRTAAELARHAAALRSPGSVPEVASAPPQSRLRWLRGLLR